MTNKITTYAELTELVKEIAILENALHPKGKWKYDELGSSIWCESKNGYMVADVRGWGHLTGGGALNLPGDEASKIQNNTGELIAKVPDMISALMFAEKRIHTLNRVLKHNGIELVDSVDGHLPRQSIKDFLAEGEK